jgi:hypothetical protein
MRAWICILLMILFFGCMSPVNQSATETNQLAAQAKCGAINDTNVNKTYPAARSECSYGPSVVDCARDFCYYDYASATDDPSVCDSVTGAIEGFGRSGPYYTSQVQCIFEVALNNNDTTVCDQMADSKIECLWEVAVKTKNITLCNQLPNDNHRNYTCYTGIAAAYLNSVTNDLSVCNESGNNDIYTLCVLDDAPMMNVTTTVCRPEFCAVVSDQFKDKCYSDSSRLCRNPSTCNMINSSDERDQCYYYFAIDFGNSTVCNEISSSSIKDDCLQNSKS